MSLIDLVKHLIDLSKSPWTMEETPSLLRATAVWKRDIVLELVKCLCFVFSCTGVDFMSKPEAEETREKLVLASRLDGGSRRTKQDKVRFVEMKTPSFV